MPEIHPSFYAIALTAIVGFAVWVGRMTEFKSTTKDFVKEIRDKLDEIFERLPPRPVSTSSPLRLTKLGEEISRTLNLSSWADRTAADLRDRIDDKSAYEIQEFCFSYMRDEFKPDPEQDAQIKDCAFENGIDIQGVLDVLAIELRDRLLGDKEPPETAASQG